MLCGKCSFEFCWFCLDGYAGYTHANNLFCPLRNVVLIGSIVIACVFMNFKIIYLYLTLFAIQWFFFYNLIAFICLKGFLATFIVYYSLFDDLLRKRRLQQAKNFMTYMYCAAAFLVLLFHVFVFWNISKYLFIYRWFEILFYEIVFGGTLGVLFLIFKAVTYLFKLFRYIFCKYVLRDSSYNFDGSRYCTPIVKCRSCK